ncbi:MAG: TIGR00730 family Rossman fold protein [Pseudomonadota bacterium]
MLKNQTEIRSVCVYCGSQSGENPDYVREARVLGRVLAEAGISIVYGGGTVGIMGAVADSARAAGGTVKGIIPDFLLEFEANMAVSADDPNTIITKNMHERKQKMFELSDAFIALPGGLGTLEEIVEMMTWAQLGRHNCPIAFLNTDGFWNPMLDLLGHMTAEGFIHTQKLVKPIVIDNAENVLESLTAANV